MEPKKAALKEILDFVRKLKKEKVSGKPKIEVEVEKEETKSAPEEGSVLSSILASLENK